MARLGSLKTIAVYTLGRLVLGPHFSRQSPPFLVRYGVISGTRFIRSSGSGLLLVFALTACGAKKEKAEVLVVSNNQRLSAASCEIPPTEGDAFDPSKLNTISLISADFNKRFNQEHLNALKNTSLAASSEFIQKAGVKIFATPGAKENCRPMAKLVPTADELMMKNWLDVAKLFEGVQADGTVRSGLVGLYESNYQGSPHIFVREDISRLDLVHEYFHHLFKSRPEADANSDLKEQFDDAVAALNRSLSSSPSSDATLQNARRTQDLHWRLLVASHLEESVIGYELLSRVVSTEITHVAKSSLGSHWDYTVVRLAAALNDWSDFHTALPAEVHAALSAEYLKKQNELDAFASKVLDLEPQVLALIGVKKRSRRTAAASSNTQKAASFSCGFVR